MGLVGRRAAARSGSRARRCAAARPRQVTRSGISLVPEGRRIFADLTVEENLRLGLSGRRSRDGRRRGHRGRLRAVPDRQGVPAAGAPARSRAASSSSSRSRARSSRGPDVLLLDEPSLGLAPKIVDVVFEALAEIRERGITVLLVEQRAQRTVAFADRTYLMANGEIRLTMTPADAGDTEHDGGGVPLVNALGALPLASIDAQVIVDAIGLGATYALMAVGIGLVFGVLRLVNFAYGQLIMAGAYTLAYTSAWPLLWSIVACFAVVIALSLAMERTVFRPLREQSPTVMLVTTFAISFVLQSVALLIDIRDDQIGEPAASLTSLNQSIAIAGVDVRKVTIVAVLVALGALGALALLLGRTEIGLRTRAAAADFRTARMLGVKANQVIGLAVVLSGALAAAVAVILTVQTPFVTPDFALHDTIIVLVGVVVGGIDRLWTATLGGFAIGFTSGIVNGALPTDSTIYLPVGRDGARDPRAAAAPGRAVRARALLGGRPRMSRSRIARARGARPDAARRASSGCSARRSRSPTSSTS